MCLFVCSFVCLFLFCVALLCFVSDFVCVCFCFDCFALFCCLLLIFVCFYYYSYICFIFWFCYVFVCFSCCYFLCCSRPPDGSHGRDLPERDAAGDERHHGRPVRGVPAQPLRGRRLGSARDPGGGGSVGGRGPPTSPLKTYIYIYIYI